MNENELLKVKNRDFFSIEDNFIKKKHIKSILMHGRHMEKTPLVTIIMPTFKRDDLIGRAIQSVLEQAKFDDYQLLIVDNDCEFGVENKTENIIKSFSSEKIIYYKNEHDLGMYGNWNRCIELAESEWVCMLHDDDLLVFDHLFTMTEALRKNPGIDFLACKHKILDTRLNSNLDFHQETLKIDTTKNNNHIIKINYKDLNFGFKTYFLGGIFKRSIAIKIGGFQTDASLIEDYFFSAKYSYHGNFYMLQRKLYCYYFGNNGALRLSIWQIQDVYEYYFYKFVSNRRTPIIKYLFIKKCKYKILDLVKNQNNGTSYIKAKCEINLKEIGEYCGFESLNQNKLVKIILYKLDKIGTILLHLKRKYFYLKSNG